LQLAPRGRTTQAVLTQELAQTVELPASSATRSLVIEDPAAPARCGEVRASSVELPDNPPPGGSTGDSFGFHASNSTTGAVIDRLMAGGSAFKRVHGGQKVEIAGA